MKQITIICENNNIVRDYPIGMTLKEIAEDMKIYIVGGILGAYVNNKNNELDFVLIQPSTVRFFGIESVDGQRAYSRTLLFVLYKAVHDLFDRHKLFLENSVASGFYCTIKQGRNILNEEGICLVKQRMREIIMADIPIIRKEMPTAEAIKLFERQGLNAKTKLLSSRGNLYTSVYSIGNVVDYFYGFLAPSTGVLKVFDLVQYDNGVILSIPDPKTNFTTVKPFVYQPKMMGNFNAYNRWQEAFKLENIGDLNEAIRDGHISDVIKIAEANQEVRFHYAADKIRKKAKNIRIILLAGPSSSGKTTSAQRLSVHLQVLGIRCVKISLDDYFVDREFTPKDENGDYDFEALEAIDVKFFNRQLNQLLKGEEVELPRFDFKTGKRFYDGTKLKLGKRDMVIIEGIHGLNPNLTPDIDDKYLYKVYVSALTTISIDGHNVIPTTDNRLIRRIIRDYRFRGYSAMETIKRWPKVREGEDKHIFPFQENADFMFNSALLYELAVLKPYIVPLLENVPQFCGEYSEARRLLKFISYFDSVGTEEIPPTSIMKEFLGGSSFRY
jgi:uridine kinase